MFQLCRVTLQMLQDRDSAAALMSHTPTQRTKRRNPLLDFDLFVKEAVNRLKKRLVVTWIVAKADQRVLHFVLITKGRVN